MKNIYIKKPKKNWKNKCTNVDIKCKKGKNFTDTCTNVSTMRKMI